MKIQRAHLKKVLYETKLVRNYWPIKHVKSKSQCFSKNSRTFTSVTVFTNSCFLKYFYFQTYKHLLLRILNIFAAQCTSSQFMLELLSGIPPNLRWHLFLFAASSGSNLTSCIIPKSFLMLTTGRHRAKNRQALNCLIYLSIGSSRFWIEKRQFFAAESDTEAPAKGHKAERTEAQGRIVPWF